MAFTKLTENLNIISQLSNKPNAIDGLSADALKAKFDEAGGKIKTFLNSTLIAQLEGSTGAGNIGISSISGLVSNTIQTALSEIAGTLFNHHARHEVGGADEIAITVPDGSVTVAKVATAAQTQYFTNIELTVAGWTSQRIGYYTQTKTGITGLLSTDIPNVHFKVPASFSNLDAQQEAFSLLYDCNATADGSITFYAKERPSVAFGVVLEVARI